MSVTSKIAFSVSIILATVCIHYETRLRNSGVKVEPLIMTYFSDGYRGEQDTGISRQHRASSAVLSIMAGQ